MKVNPISFKSIYCYRDYYTMPEANIEKLEIANAVALKYIYNDFYYSADNDGDLIVSIRKKEPSEILLEMYPEDPEKSRMAIFGAYINLFYKRLHDIKTPMEDYFIKNIKDKTKAQIAREFKDITDTFNEKYKEPSDSN